ACSPSISWTASPGISWTVSITTNTTPSRTGTASSNRLMTNVSTTCVERRLFVEPGLPEPEVVLDRMHAEALHGRARRDDLLRRVDGDPHHLLGEDVLHLPVELLALRLIQAPPRLLDERVDLRVHVARRVPSGRRRLLRVEQRVERVVRVRVRRH